MPSSPLPPALQLSDFDYALPPELIAQTPTAERSAARLLDGSGAAPVDRWVRDFPCLLNPGDLLVFNNTRVIKARLRGFKASGGAVEALVERVCPGHQVLAHVRASKTARPGSRLRFSQSGGDSFEAEVLGRGGPLGSALSELFSLQFPDDPLALLERFGEVPLPPYIAPDAAGQTVDHVRRYQTVFAERPGAVAAPTASLHFDEALLAALDERGLERTAITLHVGAGTFQPVRAERVELHRMHSEWFEVPQTTVDAVARTRACGGKVVAVGTTSVRALESAAQSGVLQAQTGETQIFITPGFAFHVVDALLTNFHLPKSTLMMLVSAFAGHERIKTLYAHAVDQRYRFFSYGDAMWLTRNPT